MHGFQPTRPKVPPRPLESAPPRPQVSKVDRQDFMRRSLDASRIRRMVGPAQGNTPLSRAFSERISNTSDALSRYHATRLVNQAAQVVTTTHPIVHQQQAQTSHIRPAFSASEDPSNMENLYYEISAPDHPPSYSQHSYQNMRMDVDGNYRLSEPAHQRPQSRGHHPPPYSQVPGSARAPQLWPSEATRAWTAAHSHSSSFSHSHRHSNNNPPGPRGHPRLQRQTSSSVKLTRSELHPIPAASGLSPTAGMVPLSVHQRSLHCSMRSPSSNLTASQLHPYFENGKVCYRYFETAGQEVGPLSHLQPSMSKSHQAYSAQTSPIQAYNQPSKDEPIYVNYPFTSPSGAAINAKTWVTTDLDGDVHEGAEPVTHPPEQSPEDEQQSTNKTLDQECSTTSFESPTQNDGAADFKALEMPTASETTHFRSHSDPQSLSTEPSQGMTGKDIASLLIEKLAEDEREGLSVATSSSASSSPHVEYPPNPYPSQHHKRPPPAYNPGSSRGHLESQGLPREGSGVFQRQDLMRRSSSGQYRQAFDVMPSGDQVLKFYRSQDFIPIPQGESTTLNPYPTRPHCQDSSHNLQAHPDTPHSSTPPLVALSNLALSTPRGYGTQMQVNPYNQYPYQAGPVLPPYPGAPRRDVILDPALRSQGLRNQRDRQGSLSGPNWSIHTEGQTRSYC